METGMLSSCSRYNRDIQKLRQEYTSTKGPYIYELFSIMIHSGSASGGHYYAYIKDFRNKKWQCFNDQNVTPVCIII
jgi:ubiquitin carboxyl-terminal hydrolase 47